MIFWLDERCFRTSQRWRMVRRLPLVLLALFLMSLLTSAWRGPG
jgi:hypothetical protein